jgi:hypothetical protein
MKSQSLRVPTDELLVWQYLGALNLVAKIVNPITFSKQFNIGKAVIDALGIFDPALNVDTKLFIDPLLLQSSKHPEFVSARNSFTKHFENIIKLLSISKQAGDVPWRNARKLLSFREFSGICLGYGAATIRGSGMGTFLSDTLMQTAKEIIDIGVTDPDLFLVLSLFEEGIGPDRISDMTANVILGDLIVFNHRIISALGIPCASFFINGQQANLPQNPFNIRIPVILVPKDVLQDLPIARDWEEVQDAASKNEQLRKRLNDTIGNIWATKSRQMKQAVKQKYLSDKNAFQILLDTIHQAPKTHYNYGLDREGLVTWLKFIRESADINPLDLSSWKARPLKVEDVISIVNLIVGQFKSLVENKGLWKEFWAGNKNRPEKSAQRIFFAIADTYCKANNLDLSPEADSGSGPVDFKFSQGHQSKVLVEIKLSRNNKLMTGYTNQLERYKVSEETKHGVYLVIDLGNLGSREQGLLNIRNDMLAKSNRVSDIVVVDASKRKSASKS